MSEFLYRAQAWEKGKEMGIKHVMFTIDSELYRRVERKAKKLGFKSVEDYAEAFLRRNAQPARKRVLQGLDDIISKFAKPTKKTYKILKTIKVAK